MPALPTSRWPRIGVILVGLFLVIQLVPYGRAHTNPPVKNEPVWDSPQTREIVRKACFDCHSNEVTWPWYSHVAPASWLVQRDVDHAREYLNFSEWGTHPRHEEAEEIEEVIVKEEMPLPPYLLLHPEARLSEAEKTQLIEGMKATIAATSAAVDTPGNDAAHDDNHDH